MSVVAISAAAFGKESPRPLEMLRSAGFEVRANPSGRTLSSDEVREHLQGVVGLVAGTERLTREVLAASPLLRCISRVGDSIEGVDLAAAKELSITVVNTPDAHVDAVAELTLAGMLAALRGLARADASLRGGGFEKPMGRLLRGKSVGFLGFGQVARALVKLLAPFDGQRWAFDPVEDTATAAVLGVRYGTLDEVLAASDIVSLHLPYAKAVHHLIGAPQLARMKEDAVLINTARGGLVDELALLTHLDSHPRAAAFLDCFEREPYQGPLSKARNAVLTSHIGSHAREARVRMEVEAVENLLATLGH
jgi:D-3-phosphoglycerate dehydrogenase / 2-oxoglutarate reductase